MALFGAMHPGLRFDINQIYKMTSYFHGKVSSIASYAGSSAAIIFGMNKDEWQVVGVLSGIFIGIITFCTNLYFKNEHLKIAKMSTKANIED